MGKRSQEITTGEGNWCSFEQKNNNVTLSPIHVFEVEQDDAVSLDWGNWMFSEGNLFNTNCGLESVCPPSFGSFVKSLHYDDSPSITKPSIALLQNEFSCDRLLIQDTEVVLNQLPTQGNHLHARSPTVLDVEQRTITDTLERQGRSLQERVMLNNHACHYHPENSLWTNKYQPEKAIEVCGNKESVRSLSEWLYIWHERGLQTSKSSTANDKRVLQQAGWNFSTSDTESETIDEENNLKNVLLVSGPYGSGKSAAIYACAKEQGFQVIEVNASDWRNGALVKQRFGEAVESHWRQRSMEGPISSESRHILKSFPGMLKNSATQGSHDEVIELLSYSEEEDSQNANGLTGKFDHRNNRIASDQNEIKTLILFEDVDATISEDHGFIATIQQLAETAKRPMILTCNSKNPILPNNLDRLEVPFTRPLLEELLHHVHMVCAAEKANIQPSLLKRFIEYCRGDIRKTIMHLQFWCQGQSYGKDCEVQEPYGPLLFDLDTGHQILPRIIPSGYPSELSELIEREITKSTLMMEGASDLMAVIDEEVNCNAMDGDEKDSVEAKKEAILSRHFSVQDGNEFSTHFDSPCEVACSSGSPVAFTRRNVCRKFNTVLSSSSVDEDFDDKFPESSNIPGEETKETLINLHGNSHSHSPAAGTCFDPLSELLLHSEGHKLGQDGHHCPEPADDSPINRCKSFDVSCVPESSFVPETEISNGERLFSRTHCCSHVADLIEVDSADLMQNLLPIEGENLNTYSDGLHGGLEITSTFDINMEPITGEEVGDSQSQCKEAFSRGYQILDECSRMDFSRRSKNIKKPTPLLVTDSVQEIWKKLRVCHADLKKHVNPATKDALQLLKLSSRMCNLIDVADLLLGNCQLLSHDSVDPDMVPCEEAKPFSWYDDQLQMASTIANHGFCFYTKEVAALRSQMGHSSRIDLAWEMLSSSTSSMALGKLVNQGTRLNRNIETGASQSNISLKSDNRSCLHSIIQGMVPSKSYLAVKGNAFHEYLSSLGQISRSEASRLSEGIDKTKRRRSRVARHYLSTGPMMLSPQDISLLGQYGRYQKHSSYFMGDNLS